MTNGVRTGKRYLLMGVLSLLIGFAMSPAAQAQIFSIDGASVSAFSTDDILVDMPGATPTPPMVLFPGSGFETDAVSLGYLPDNFDPSWAVEFSVAPGSFGLPGTAVFGEATAGTGADEPADIFIDTGSGNILVADGDGVANPGAGFVPGGLGLIEPFTTPGDNLDAWDNSRPAEPVPLWFSLDLATAPALGIGAVGADVLLAVPPYLPTPASTPYDAPGFPSIYAPGLILGLDSPGVGGPGSDELDAVVVFDDGDLVYTPADIVMFSLSAASPSLSLLSGTPFAGFSGADIFVQLGAGATPTLFRPASALGLSGSDELDALDIVFGMSVPEPGTSALMLLGFGLLALARRRFAV